MITEGFELADYACSSANSRGRAIEEKSSTSRTEFQRDRDRIIHSSAFRRLEYKTQVFVNHEGDLFRTRLTHTLEVSQNARTIAKALRVNEDLTEAIALGHDLGHTPFGHAGERELNRICSDGFRHQLQSVRVVEKLEKGGVGLNLTKEVRDGICNHSTSGTPATLEGKIVRLCDKIAYVNSDIDDAVRGRVIRESDLPERCVRVLGSSLRERLNTLIHDIVSNSVGKDDIIMSEEKYEALRELRKYMFDNVYINSCAKVEEGKAERMIRQLFEYYVGHMEELPEEYTRMVWEKGETVERAVCDYIAGMTDRYAVTTFQKLMVPTTWQVY